MNFEEAKENIQPLVCGRNASVLATSLTSHSEIEKQREVFEAAIKNYHGDDPLQPWYDYIQWIEQSYPSGGNESGLKKVLLKCLTTFEEDKRYYQDRRMIKIYIKYIDGEENPIEMYQELYNSGVGTMVADLYICWAYYYDLAWNFQKADAIFKKGLEVRAQPYEELEQAHKHFGFTMSQRLLNQDEASKEEFACSMQEQRKALTSLRPHKKKIGSIRTGRSVIKSENPGKIKLNVEQPGTGNSCHNIKVVVFQDQNKDPNFPAQNDPAEEHHIPIVRNIIDSARKQENMREPGPWSKQGPHKKGNLFGSKSHNHEIPFTILEDQEIESTNKDLLQELPSIPDYYSKGVSLPPDFAKTNYPQGRWNVKCIAENDIKPNCFPQYNKIFCYPKPDVEFSLEEVQAYKWLKKHGKHHQLIEECDKFFSNDISVGARCHKYFPTSNVSDKRDICPSKVSHYLPNNTKMMIKIDEVYPNANKAGSLSVENCFEEILFEKLKSGKRKIHFCGEDTICIEEGMDETQCLTNIVGRKSIFPSRKSMAPFASERKTIFKPSIPTCGEKAEIGFNISSASNQVKESHIHAINRDDITKENISQNFPKTSQGNLDINQKNESRTSNCGTVPKVFKKVSQSTKVLDSQTVVKCLKSGDAFSTIEEQQLTSTKHKLAYCLPTDEVMHKNKSEPNFENNLGAVHFTGNQNLSRNYTDSQENCSENFKNFSAIDASEQRKKNDKLEIINRQIFVATREDRKSSSHPESAQIENLNNSEVLKLRPTKIPDSQTVVKSLRRGEDYPTVKEQQPVSTKHKLAYCLPTDAVSQKNKSESNFERNLSTVPFTSKEQLSRNYNDSQENRSENFKDYSAINTSEQKKKNDKLEIVSRQTFVATRENRKSSSQPESAQFENPHNSEVLKLRATYSLEEKYKLESQKPINVQNIQQITQATRSSDIESIPNTTGLEMREQVVQGTVEVGVKPNLHINNLSMPNSSATIENYEKVTNTEKPTENFEIYEDPTESFKFVSPPAPQHIKNNLPLVSPFVPELENDFIEPSPIGATQGFAADETCSTLAFNLFIKSQSVSTPISKQAAAIKEQPYSTKFKDAKSLACELGEFHNNELKNNIQENEKCIDAPLALTEITTEVVKAPVINITESPETNCAIINQNDLNEQTPTVSPNFTQQPPTSKQLSTILEISEPVTLPTTSIKSSTESHTHLGQSVADMNSTKNSESRNRVNFDSIKVNKSEFNFKSKHDIGESLAPEISLDKLETFPKTNISITKNNLKLSSQFEKRFETDLSQSQKQSIIKATSTDINNQNYRKSIFNSKECDIATQPVNERLSSVYKEPSCSTANDLANKLSNPEVENLQSIKKPTVENQPIKMTSFQIFEDNTENVPNVASGNLMVSEENSDRLYEYFTTTPEKKGPLVSSGLNYKANNTFVSTLSSTPAPLLNESGISTNKNIPYSATDELRNKLPISKAEKLPSMTKQAEEDVTQPLNLKSLQVFEEKTETVPKFILKRPFVREESFQDDYYNYFSKTPEKKLPTNTSCSNDNAHQSIISKPASDIKDMTFSNIKELTLPKLLENSKFLSKDSPVAKLAKMSFIKGKNESNFNYSKCSINAEIPHNVSAKNFEKDLPKSLPMSTEKPLENVSLCARNENPTETMNLHFNNDKKDLSSQYTKENVKQKSSNELDLPPITVFEENAETDAFSLGVSAIKNSTFLHAKFNPQQIHEKSLHIKDEPNSSKETSSIKVLEVQHGISKNNTSRQKKLFRSNHIEISNYSNDNEDVPSSQMRSLVISEGKRSQDHLLNEKNTNEDEEGFFGRSIYEKHTFHTPAVAKHGWCEEDDEDTEEYFVHVRPENLDRTTYFINDQIQNENFNPFSKDLIRAFLEKIDFTNYLSTWDSCELRGKINMLKKGDEVRIHDDVFTVLKIIGEGAFGTIYSGKHKNSGKIFALKQEKPANLWEYYICLELKDRLENQQILAGFMEVKYALVGNNASILLSEYSPYGSLITICNSYKRSTSKNLDEYIVMVITTQLLSIIDHLHGSEIIHADIKPDNFLLMTKLSYPYTESAIQLIDFGISIDMKLYPLNYTFNYKHNRDDFKCIEMREDRPWTYQTDLYGLAGTIHVLLYGKYMEVKKNLSSLWMPKQNVPRYLNKNIWDSVFQNLLNIRDCKSMPNLQKLKLAIDEILIDKHKFVQDKLNEFNSIIKQ